MRLPVNGTCANQSENEMTEKPAAPTAVQPAEQAAPTKPAVVVDETGAALRAHVEKMQKRIDIVSDIFKDNKFSPLTSKAFTKFIVDQYCEVSMRFILMGVVRDGDEAMMDEKLRKQGFTVAGAPTDAPAKENEAKGFIAPSMPMPQESGSGILDENHPLIAQARELGFDPTVEPE